MIVYMTRWNTNGLHGSVNLHLKTDSVLLIIFIVCDILTHLSLLLIFESGYSMKIACNGNIVCKRASIIYYVHVVKYCTYIDVEHAQAQLILMGVTTTPKFILNSVSLSCDVSSLSASSLPH